MTSHTVEPKRDLVGYCNQPPVVSWPGDARVAVSFCINYEEGAELCLMNGDDRSESRIADLIVEARHGERDLNMESNYDYGARAGYWRVLKAFTDRAIKATVNLVGVAGIHNPYALEAMLESGCDLQPHGWRWIDYHALSEDEEREHIEKCVAQVVSLTGERPLGYYAGMPSLNTRRLLVELGGFLYDSDSYADDLPYWVYEFEKPHLVVPYSLETNDSRFSRGEGYQIGADFCTYIRDTFDCLYAEGESRPQMMTVGLHARLLGRPGRIKALHDILDYMLRHESVWICRRGDLAKHWAQHHPAESTG